MLFPEKNARNTFLLKHSPWVCEMNKRLCKDSSVIKVKASKSFE